MPTLTRDNAKYKCRICLVRTRNIGADAECNNGGAAEEMQECKDIAINITTNIDLQHLMAMLLNGEEEELESSEDFPENLCLSCYNQLQNFEKFRRRAKESAHKLHLVLDNNSGVTKIEIDYDEDEEQEKQNSKQTQNMDIFRMLQKDSLMETESVLLDSSAVATLASAEMHPDPFSVPTPQPEKRTNSTNELYSDNSDREDEDLVWQKSENDESSDESSETTNSEESLKDRKAAIRRNTRQSNRLKKDKTNENALNESDKEENVSVVEKAQNALCASRTRSKKTKSSSKRQSKKKRRTKKEMQEFRLSIADKGESGIKRRNKGTKNSFKCTQCNHCFAHKITLDAHIRKVHEGSKRPFQCDRCDKSYTFIGGLYTHIKEIHDTVVRSYSCDFPECDRIYTSFIAMQKHKRLKHTEISYQKKYVCEQCGTTFNQSGNLKYHRRTKHPTDDEQAEKEKTKERFECLICKKFFHSRYTLKYHTLQLHTNDMKYECNVCGRRMAKKFMLVQHMLVHSTDKMPCEHCGKQFIRKFELEAHIRAVHMKLKPFECQYCSECFASRKTLRHHEYIHTGEKPYVCDICGQAYRQQTCLKNHRKSHEKLSAEALLAANINRTLMNTFLGPQPALSVDAAEVPVMHVNKSESTAI